jgi:hypothetical protein
VPGVSSSDSVGTLVSCLVPITGSRGPHHSVGTLEADVLITLVVDQLPARCRPGRARPGSAGITGGA